MPTKPAPKKNVKRTLPAPSAKKITAAPPKPVEALTDADFFYQLKNGGDRGWNDQIWRQEDLQQGSERFYLRYYGTTMGSVELLEQEETKKTKITIFGQPQDIPATETIERAKWVKMQEQVVEAIKDLRISFK